MTYKLTDDNYVGVAMKFYDNTQCNTVEEFESDLYKIVCIKKMIDRYNTSGVINMRLLLNHFIILHNAFGKLAPELLRLRLSEHHYPVVKAVLMYLKYIVPERWDDVIEDSKIFNELRKI